MENKETLDEGAAGVAADSAESAYGQQKETGCQDCPVGEWTEALREMEGAMRGWLPPAFWQHRRAAQKEALLAVRSLLDAAIERADREPPARQGRTPKKIVVQ
jgi:hypothetical protein